MIGALRSIRTAAGILLTTVLGVSISAAQTPPDSHSPPTDTQEKAPEHAPAAPPRPVARPPEANGKPAEGGPPASTRPDPASRHEGDKPADGGPTPPEHSASPSPEAGSPGAGEPPAEAGPTPRQAGENGESAAKLSPAATLQPIDMEEVTSLLGKKVRSAGDEDMGMVVDVLIGADGQPRAAVIDFGGFLGVGSRKVAVHWQALQFRLRDRAAPLVLNLDKADVQAAPEFKPASQPPEVVAPTAPPDKNGQPPAIASPAPDAPAAGADHAPAGAQLQPPQAPANPPSSPAAGPNASPGQPPAAAPSQPAPAPSGPLSTSKAVEKGPEQKPDTTPPRPPAPPAIQPPAPDAGR